MVPYEELLISFYEYGRNILCYLRSNWLSLFYIILDMSVFFMLDFLECTQHELGFFHNRPPCPPV